MLLELVLQDERREGKAEGIVDLLQELGTVSEELQERILAETSSKKIKSWLKLAAKLQMPFSAASVPRKNIMPVQANYQNYFNCRGIL